MSFQSPLWLLGLLVVPLLVALYIVRERRRGAYQARFASLALLPNVIDHSPGIRRHLPVVVLLVALATMVVGVARPHATVSVKREEATVMLAIDVSNSMRANDVPPTRLAAARAAVDAFVAKVPKRFQVGLISIGSRATVSLPPTTDRALLDDALASLHASGGTALGDAVVLSTRVVQRQRSADGKVAPAALLVISDGKLDGGRTSLDAAAKQAKAAHLPVYALALGTPNGVIRQKLTGGYTATIQVPASPDSLKQLAQATGGRFFTAADDSRLGDVYQRLGSRLGHRSVSRELTDVFAAAAVLLLLLGGGLSALWFKRVVP